MSADVNAKGNDPVNHPAHYTQGTMETWEAIEGLNLGYHAGNVVKYLSRYKFKDGIRDLRKARAYLDRLILIEERANEPVAIQGGKRKRLVKTTNKGNRKRQRKGSINRRKRKAKSRLAR